MWLHSCNIIPAYSWQNIATASWRSVSTCPIVGLKPFKISAWKATKLTNKTKNENMMSESMLVCPLRAISPLPCFKHLQVNPLLTRKCLFTVLVTFSRRACHFVRKQKRQTHPRSKLRQIYFAMRQLCEGPKMLQLRRPLVGRTSYCMPVPLEDARSFLGFSVKATQRICLSYMLLKNNSNRRKYEFVRNWPRALDSLARLAK